MNEPQSKPPVTPPAGYKTPSLPTLAALGVLSAAALSGCDGVVKTMVPAQVKPVEEKTPDNIPEGGDVQMMQLDGDVLIDGF